VALQAEAQGPGGRCREGQCREGQCRPEAGVVLLVRAVAPGAGAAAAR
jgi:hypothetical protein